MKATIIPKKTEVVVVQDESIQLDLSIENAKALYVLCGRISGMPTGETVRFTTDEVYGVLKELLAQHLGVDRYAVDDDPVVKKFGDTLVGALRVVPLEDL